MLFLVCVNVLANDDGIVNDDPRTKMKANSDMTFTVTSSPGISMMAPRNEIGIPRLTQNASRRSRKSASSTNASANPVSPVRSIVESRVLMI